MNVTENELLTVNAALDTQQHEQNPNESLEGKSQIPGIYTMQDWLKLQLSTDEKEIVIGTPENSIIRPKTKNLIEAAEKSFKTTFLLRLLGGLSCGETVFPELHVVRPRRVLYLHGELSNPEIKERTTSLAKSLQSRNFTNFWQGRVLNAHLIREDGRAELRKLIEACEPDDVAIDPWQSFIVGHEENSYKDMSEATQFCSQLIENYGVTLWIPIHLGKNPSKGARGHSTIAGWRDTKIKLTRNDGSITVDVDPRWGTPPRPFSLRFRNGTLWPDEGLSSFTEQATRMREFLKLKGGSVSTDSLREHLGLNLDAFRKALDRAQKQGAVVRGEDSVGLPMEASLTDQTSIQ